MGVVRLSWMAVAAALAAACTGSPAQPSEAGPSRTLRGQIVNAVDGTPVPGVTVHVAGAQSATTDLGGLFSMVVDSPGTFTTTVFGGGFVERATTLNGPTSEGVRLSIIPTSFDLPAFDEMFRSSGARLQRWTSRPALAVIGSVLTYRGGNASDYTATDESIPVEEVSEMVAHLTEGLGLLTGGTFASFTEVNVERPVSGEKVTTARPGQIVVGRYSGIVSLAGTIGLGRWAEDSDGTVVGGAMFLDREFDKRDPRRRLLRIHELGHALGYTHVQSRASIMNPAIGPEPTEFDRTGARIAFQRPPGNRAPDADPGSAPRHTTGPSGSVRWAPPID